MAGSRRVVEPEILSDSSASEVCRNLSDLSRINRWFGGHRVLGGLLSQLVDSKDSFSLLDVGSASGDMSCSIQRGFPEARVVSLDCCHFHVKHASGSRVVGDAFGLPFRPQCFDFVFCSLLLHEYSDDAAQLLMKRLHAVARRALIVVDLYRHPLAVRFLPATSWLFRWSDVTLHDGPVSVKAAFRPWELREIATKAGLGDVRVRRHMPWFRISMVARRNGV